MQFLGQKTFASQDSFYSQLGVENPHCQTELVNWLQKQWCEHYALIRNYAVSGDPKNLFANAEEYYEIPSHAEKNIKRWRGQHSTVISIYATGPSCPGFDSQHS